MDEEQPKDDEELLFKGKHLCCKISFQEQCGFVRKGSQFYNEHVKAYSFQGHLKWNEIKKERRAVIRQIRIADCRDDWEETLKTCAILDSNNLIKVLAYEDDKVEWRYFALEPFTSTLFHYVSGHYKGPMPMEPDVVFQILNGINYLHEFKLIHGDLNPTTIVISSHYLPARIKISDFGLAKLSYTEIQSQESETSVPVAFSEVCKRKYWRLSGIDSDECNPELIFKPTEEEDNFAVGCLVFYFLEKGVHPFGNIEMIEANIKAGNPINLNKLDEIYTVYKTSIGGMITLSVKSSLDCMLGLRKALIDVEASLWLKTDYSKKLGKGSFGNVYAGTFKGQDVAVKEIEVLDCERIIMQREIECHLRLEHPNVVKLLEVSLSKDFTSTLLVLDLCVGTLTEFCKDTFKIESLLPSDDVVVLQIVSGVEYIHSQNLIHRDIKPDNILVSLSNPAELKISDFTFVKETQQGRYCQSKIRGSPLWMAPELLEQLHSPSKLSDETIATDTFSTGCVLFYFLTRGRHPFGEPPMKYMAINNPVELLKKKEDLKDSHLVLYSLIAEMIKRKENRIGLSEVKKKLTDILSAKLTFDSPKPDKITEVSYGQYAISEEDLK